MQLQNSTACWIADEDKLNLHGNSAMFVCDNGEDKLIDVMFENLLIYI